MPRLISRQKFIPNGFKFYDAVLKWTAPANASFAVICEGLRAARTANPGLTRSKGLNVDPAAIAEEVDAYNAAICEAHGWNDYISGSGGAATPFPQSARPAFNLNQRAKAVVAGSEVLVEWIASGAEAVPQQQSHHRAEVCSKCPLNGRGGWERWFTVPAANAIRAALRHKGEFRLSTPFDDQLGVCEACLCVNALKVHVPFNKFFPKMEQAAKDSLDPNCWIRSEMAK